MTPFASTRDEVVCPSLHPENKKAQAQKNTFGVFSGTVTTYAERLKKTKQKGIFLAKW
jgi:hypothetical protein